MEKPAFRRRPCRSVVGPGWSKQPRTVKGTLTRIAVPETELLQSVARAAAIVNPTPGAPMDSKMQRYGRKHQHGLNLVTTLAMIGFHVGAVAAFFFIDAGAMLTALILYVVAGMLGHRHGVSPSADPPGLQDLQVGRVRPHLVRHAGARRRSDLLGGDASHPPPAFGSRRRSAHAARRHLVGARRLDPQRRRSAP